MQDNTHKELLKLNIEKMNDFKMGKTLIDISPKEIYRCQGST